ncbi:MAG: choice-of-anchor Q domain-containing protein [Cyanobacteria bacterium J06621_12]
MQEFIVSNLEDENDGDLSAGDLSLREAIALANEQEGADTISFDSNLNGSIVLTQGELQITDALTINGSGANNIVIDGNNSSRIFKIDDGSENSIDVTINGVTITNGEIAQVEGDDAGGGILNSENLTLVNSTVTGNRARLGGGIYSQGNLTVQSSNIDSNFAGIFDLEINGVAGGIFTNSGNNRIIDSSVSNNNSSNQVGGIRVSDNNIEIINSVVSDYTAPIIGGIELTSSTANIDNSTISGNSATVVVGGIRNEFSETTISNSAITENGSGTFSTGALDNIGGTVTLNNSTVANNSGDLASGITNFPLPSDSPYFSTINVNNSTITGNSGVGINQIDGRVPDPLGNNNGAINITSSIVADNFAIDISFNSGTINSGGNNFIGSSEPFELGQEDIVGTFDNPIDARLGELQDDGISPAFIPLLEDSPAINAGSNPNGFAFDQRGGGFNRTVGNGTDIGAFELQTVVDNGGGGIIPDELPDELIVSTLEDENDGDFSAGDLSLREAIALANEQEGADTISFDANISGSIVLTQGELEIDDALTINGSGAENIAIDGNNSSRVLSIIPGAADLVEVTINDITVTGGNDGGISNVGILTIKNSVIEENTSEGILNNAGSLDLIDSTVANNIGTGIENAVGTLNISNSTISGNSADGIISPFFGSVSVNNSTITNNSGSGIRRVVLESIDGIIPGEFDLTSSIVADNGGFDIIQVTIGDETPVFATENVNSGGNNLVGSIENDSGFLDSDLVGSFNSPIDPQLGALQNNGGATSTQALLENSPAIDAGSNPNGLVNDQRGEGFNRTVGAGTDIGAFELQTIVDNVSEIVGTAGGDVLEGTESSDRFLGLDGNDTIRGFAGNDTIEGNNGNDSIEGGAGDDLLDGFDGFDTLLGGEGNDILNAGSGNDSLDGSIGDDSLNGADGSDTLLGGDGQDILDGGLGSDSIEGGDGNDVLIGLGDRDTLLGGDGDDFLDGGAGVDFLDGGANNDQLFGGLYNDSLRGGSGEDRLDGGAGIDSIEGGQGNDTLFGLDGDDSLFGGSGNDFIDGGLGSDSLRGDDGDDTFVLASGNGTDFITDFNRGNNLLGLSSGLDFADLSFSGNNIIVGTEVLASLNGVQTTSLTESDFVIV